MLFDVHDSSVDSYSSLMNLALPMLHPSYESVDVYNDITSIPATVLESDDRHASADLGVVYNDITAIPVVIENHDRQQEIRNGKSTEEHDAKPRSDSLMKEKTKD